MGSFTLHAQSPLVGVKNLEKVSLTLANQRIVKALVIGDAHDSVHFDKHRFALAGAYIADTRPDIVVAIGDFLTMDSLNSHDEKGTLSDKRKPSLKQDLESGEQALDNLFYPMVNLRLEQAKQKHKQYRPLTVITMGNHDSDSGGDGKGRWDRYVGKNPELVGQTPITDLYSEYFDIVIPYGNYFVAGNIGFTHIPFDTSNKPIGGIFACRKAVLASSLPVLVFGHQHSPSSYMAEFNNPLEENDHRVAICTGAFSPVESYARPGPSAWDCNLTEVTLVDGKYVSHKFINIKELEVMYD